MTEILTALATAAGLLLPIVVFITIACITAVRRGEAGTHHAHDSHVEPVAEGGAPAAVAAPRELSVMEILLFAAGLFALAMLALLGVSLVGHM